MSNEDPYPSGSEAVAAIARRLLADVDVHKYSPAPSTKRLLTVLLSVPRESAETIRQLARECVTEEHFREEEPFVDLVLSTATRKSVIIRSEPDRTDPVVIQLAVSGHSGSSASAELDRTDPVVIQLADEGQVCESREGEGTPG